MQEISEKEALIFDVVKYEWELFQQVRNTGGRASCQDNPNTFFKMRMSQWMVYSIELLQSYYNDMQEAFKEGRNVIFQKYGFMMESTYNEEYLEILPYLKQPHERAVEIITQLIPIHIQWDKEVFEKYPKLRSNGRAFLTKDDNEEVGSSSESYFVGECKTYSVKTLECLKEEMTTALKQGRNILLEIIENEVKFYGYDSIEAAESSSK